MGKAIRFICTITLVVILLSCSNDVKDIQKDIPKFTISGRYQEFYSVIVPVDSTEKQLINLIQEIREARIENNLNKYFSPTTPNGKMGDYAIVGVYVFSDPYMAAGEALRKYIYGSDKNPSDVEFAQQFANKVLAHYYFAVPDVEFGCIGLRDSGIEPTATYKKLFGNNIPY
ncbi:MAG: hypothetical protein HY753_08310 [Nitrospirae bacterium]|nr:hypothetical protein [Nitrospirota bacterium]MBI4842729.1 hypothetical protein [Nitrospirota bacterium]